VAVAVFVYGRLLLPEVMEAVTGRVLHARPALLRGYARRRLRGCDEPVVSLDATRRA
jgi:hypothetical protein